MIKRFIERCCEIDFDLRMSEEEFLKLELYPRRPEETKPLKNHFLSKTSTSFKQEQPITNSNVTKVSGSKVSKVNEEVKGKIEKKEVMDSLKDSPKLVAQSRSKRALTERVNNESCKTSQYSTEAQTRAIKDFTSSISSSSDAYKKNSEILLKQNSFCKHLYFMIKNIEHFLLTDENKELLTIVMYKHILYMLKKLKNTKFNYFQLKKW